MLNRLRVRAAVRDPRAVFVSLATAAPDVTRLGGLVYSLTPRIRDTAQRWHQRPAMLGGCAIAAVVALNILFW